MACYRIGPLTVHLPSAPESWQSFRTEACGTPDLWIERREGLPELEGWTLLAEHEMMDVWRHEHPERGWLFHSRFDGWMWLSGDYSHGCCYGPSEAAYALLLQAAAECALTGRGMLVLHAACVAQDGAGVAFSAPSGSGKSTRAAGWVRLLGGTLLSGDRPGVDPAAGSVFGVPWDGKEQVFVNRTLPLRGVLEVRRASRTELRRMTERQAWAFLSGQLFIPMWDTRLAAKALSGLGRLLRTVPVYRLFCDQNDAAVRETHQILFRHPEQINIPKEEIAMKMKSGFEVVEIDGDYLALPTGDNVAAFAGSVVLNEVSATLLRELAARECTKEDLLELLLNEYEVEQAVAAADLDKILKTFTEIGLIA